MDFSLGFTVMNSFSTKAHATFLAPNRLVDSVQEEVAKRLSEEGDAVGDVDKDTKVGFSVGQAPASARPVTQENEKRIEGEQGITTLSPDPTSTCRTQTPALKEFTLDRNAAYEDFKNNTEQGKLLKEALKEQQMCLREVKSAVKVGNETEGNMFGLQENFSDTKKGLVMLLHVHPLVDQYDGCRQNCCLIPKTSLFHHKAKEIYWFGILKQA